MEKIRKFSRLKSDGDFFGGVLWVEVPEVLLRQRLPEPAPDQIRAPTERYPVGGIDIQSRPLVRSAFCP